MSLTQSSYRHLPGSDVVVGIDVVVVLCSVTDTVVADSVVLFCVCIAIVGFVVISEIVDDVVDAVRFADDVVVFICDEFSVVAVVVVVE